MADEFMILFGRKSDGVSPSDKVVGVFLAQGNSLTVTSADEDDLDGWGEYVESDPAWKDIHAKDEQPLSSMLGRSGYTPGAAFPYDSENKEKYDEAVKAVGGKTKTFKPKKD
jgi:hypothetical protein